jgi:uncharacterized repeat protein (TIGR01451 family)
MPLQRKCLKESSNIADSQYGLMQKLHCFSWSAFLIFVLLIASLASAQMTVDSHNVMPGGTAVFIINVSNTGETPLNPVKVIDTLPIGMSYVTDDRNPKGQSTGSEVIWPNVGPVDIGESTAIHLLTKIDRRATGRLINHVSVIGSPVPDGYEVTNIDKEYVDVKQPPRSPKVIQNIEAIELGNQLALANRNGMATNNIKIVCV